MVETIGEILSNGVGVAISPLPVVAVILILFSPAAGRNGLAFLAGWVLGLTVVGGALTLVAPEPDGTGPSTPIAVVELVVGALFLVLAHRQWHGRPRGDETPQLPGWMAAVAGFSAPRALGMGALLVVANPKNLGLAVTAGGTIGSSDLERAGKVVVLIVFVALGSLSVLVPVVANLLAPERARPVLTSMRDWLTVNSSTVMAVLLLVLGAKVLGQGLSVFG